MGEFLIGMAVFAGVGLIVVLWWTFGGSFMGPPPAKTTRALVQVEDTPAAKPAAVSTISPYAPDAVVAKPEEPKPEESKPEESGSCCTPLQKLQLWGWICFLGGTGLGIAFDMYEDFIVTTFWICMVGGGFVLVLFLTGYLHSIKKSEAQVAEGGYARTV